jgi:hypothetical protein
MRTGCGASRECSSCCAVQDRENSATAKGMDSALQLYQLNPSASLGSPCESFPVVS